MFIVLHVGTDVLFVYSGIHGKDLPMLHKGSNVDVWGDFFYSLLVHQEKIFQYSRKPGTTLIHFQPGTELGNTRYVTKFNIQTPLREVPKCPLLHLSTARGT